MNAKKKTLLSILCLLTFVFSVIGLAGCASTETPCEHDWGEWTVTDVATCTQGGKKTRTCAKCGESQNESIYATGHTEVIDEGVSATCTTAGKTEGKHCSVCGDIIVAQTEIPATIIGKTEFSISGNI